MPPTLEQLSLALADSLDDRPLGMVTIDLISQYASLVSQPASPEDEGSRIEQTKIRYHSLQLCVFVVQAKRSSSE
jgi:hypothetical protein